MLCILTSFQVLAGPESWLNCFFSAVFNLFDLAVKSLKKVSNEQLCINYTDPEGVQLI